MGAMQHMFPPQAPVSVYLTDHIWMDQNMKKVISVIIATAAVTAGLFVLLDKLYKKAVSGIIK